MHQMPHTNLFARDEEKRDLPVPPYTKAKVGLEPFRYSSGWLQLNVFFIQATVPVSIGTGVDLQIHLG